MAEYNVNKVKNKLCIHCHKPIGNKPYEEIRVFARFGQMLFKHKECVSDARLTKTGIVIADIYNRLGERRKLEKSAR